MLYISSVIHTDDYYCLNNNIFMSYSNENDACMLLIIMCVSIYMAMGLTIHIITMT